MEKNTKMVWGIVVVIAIIAIVIFAVRNNKNNASLTGDANTAAEVEGTEDIAPVLEPSTEVKVNTGAISISYRDALVKYADRRIQLGAGQQCSATPNNVTYKNGTSIMIDNRSPESRTIKLGGTYTVKGYGFRIITLNSSTVPATWLLDCGTQQNVATILIQK